MKIKSALVTQISGSIGGMTGSRNRGGNYLRARAIPTDPSSAAQQRMRAIFAFSSSGWAGLTAAQRAAWSLFGENVPVTDALGDSINLSGQQWYVASVSTRVNANISPVSDGPTVFTRPEVGELDTLTAEPPDEIAFTYDATQLWATETGGALIVQVGRPQGAGVNFFRGPWRTAGTILGDDTTPPTSPAAIASPFALTDDQNVWVRVIATTADGRVSAPVILGPAIVTTP